MISERMSEQVQAYGRAMFLMYALPQGCPLPLQLRATANFNGWLCVDEFHFAECLSFEHPLNDGLARICMALTPKPQTTNPEPLYGCLWLVLRSTAPRCVDRSRLDEHRIA
ncbi:unnamed protein product [Symbiodinium sp. CCMP2592]|nr:unnamed protein product [Symbiodinium sp. CCMP2592]